MAAEPQSQNVFVTGATGFVGGAVTRELVRRGYTPVCLARDASAVKAKFNDLPRGSVKAIQGDLLADDWHDALRDANCAAVVHLVGIIYESPLSGQTFQRVHVEGTRNVVNAAVRAEVPRFIHMSALGARLNGPSEYSRTKGEAENIVRTQAPRWTIFRPSIIHGPDGEFMEMMKFFSTSKLRMPFMPYFGSGEYKLQPISVKDVAHCFVAAIGKEDTIGKTYDLGGPEQYTWKQLYDTCAQAITGHKRLKLPVPVPVAKAAAMTVMKLRIWPLTWAVPYPFNNGQVAMSQEDSVCPTAPIEAEFGLKLRSFRDELQQYANEIA